MKTPSHISPLREPANHANIGRVASKLLLATACALLVGTVVYSVITGKSPMNWCFYGGFALMFVHRVPTTIAKKLCQREARQHARKA